MKTYEMDGKTVLWDRCRRIFVQTQPEERIRQLLVENLIKRGKLDPHSIETEFPVCRLHPRAKGRVDILVFNKPWCTPGAKPLLAIEIKHRLVTGSPLEQVIGYQQVLRCPYVAVAFSERISELDIREVTKHGSLCAITGLQKVSRLPRRTVPAARVFDDSALFNGPEEPGGEEIGKQSWQDLQRIWRKKPVYSAEDVALLCMYYAVTDLYAYFFQTRRLFSKPFKTAAGLELKEDKGIVLSSFSNAAGGCWNGFYRTLVVRDKKGKIHGVRLGIMASGESSGDAVFGNRKSYTVLIVGIDSPDLGAHSSLQLRFEKFAETDESRGVVIWHDGTMTAGKRGALKREDVMKHIGRVHPKLINDGKVILGRVPALSNDGAFGGKTALEFLGRLAAYALVRDELRVELKS